uniref:Uncharacterized protein n=1 Tax=Globodera pallida TaxID=36090 RepID=A0A183CI79_GLOPA
MAPYLSLPGIRLWPIWTLYYRFEIGIKAIDNPLKACFLGFERQQLKKLWDSISTSLRVRVGVNDAVVCAEQLQQIVEEAIQCHLCASTTTAKAAQAASATSVDDHQQQQQQRHYAVGGRWWSVGSQQRQQQQQ